MIEISALLDVFKKKRGKNSVEITQYCEIFVGHIHYIRTFVFMSHSCWPIPVQHEQWI